MSVPPRMSSPVVPDPSADAPTALPFIWLQSPDPMRRAIPSTRLSTPSWMSKPAPNGRRTPRRSAIASSIVSRAPLSQAKLIG